MKLYFYKITDPKSKSFELRNNKYNGNGDLYHELNWGKCDNNLKGLSGKN